MRKQRYILSVLAYVLNIFAAFPYTIMETASGRLRPPAHRCGIHYWVSKGGKYVQNMTKYTSNTCLFSHITNFIFPLRRFWSYAFGGIRSPIPEVITFTNNLALCPASADILTRSLFLQCKEYVHAHGRFFRSHRLGHFTRNHTFPKPHIPALNSTSQHPPCTGPHTPALVLLDGTAMVKWHDTSMALSWQCQHKARALPWHCFGKDCTSANALKLCARAQSERPSFDDRCTGQAGDVLELVHLLCMSLWEDVSSACVCVCVCLCVSTIVMLSGCCDVLVLSSVSLCCCKDVFLFRSLCFCLPVCLCQNITCYAKTNSEHQFSCMAAASQADRPEEST